MIDTVQQCLSRYGRISQLTYQPKSGGKMDFLYIAKFKSNVYLFMPGLNYREIVCTWWKIQFPSITRFEIDFIAHTLLLPRAVLSLSNVILVFTKSARYLVIYHNINRAD